MTSIPPSLIIRVYRDATCRELVAELRLPDEEGSLLALITTEAANENREAPLTVEEALALLNEREQAWLTFQPHDIEAAQEKEQALAGIRGWREHLLKTY